MRHIISTLGALGLATAMLAVSPLHALESDQLPPGYTLGMNARTGHLGSGDYSAGGVLGNRANGSLLGVDSVQNFSSYFYFPGVVPSAFGDFPQFAWQYTMVGKSPFRRSDGDDDDGGTTRIRAPIIPVTIDLRNSDGSPRFCTGPQGTVRLILSPTPYVAPTLASPIFQSTGYSSSIVPTQFTDAIMRAEFYGVASHRWHTLLEPSVKTGRTMVLIRGTYRFSVDANCNLIFVLVDSSAFTGALFPPGPGDTTTVMGQAETAGDITTKDISTFLFANTFLYDNGDPSQCCTLGFHSYDLKPGDASNGWRERRYVMNFSSWVTPGLFGASFQDITALSHELAETFNDPFVNNATPIWLAPNGLCQNNLETGDVIEGLPNATNTIHLGGVAYHVQNEALLQWFAGQTPSSAINGAYSYPDPVLTTPSVSLFSDCQTPVPPGLSSGSTVASRR
jgi:hypothetical protein